MNVILKFKVCWSKLTEVIYRSSFQNFISRKSQLKNDIIKLCVQIDFFKVQSLKQVFL